MKNTIKFLSLFVICGFLAFAFSGCVTVKVNKTADAAVKDKNAQVSDEEFDSWKKLAKDGRDSVGRAKGAVWAGPFHYHKKNYPDGMKYVEFNQKYYSDTDFGYLSMVRLF